MKSATRLGIGWVFLLLGAAYLLTFQTPLARYYNNIVNIAVFALSIWLIFGSWQGGWRAVSSIVGSIALLFMVGVLFYLVEYVLLKQYNEMGAGGFAVYFAVYYTLPSVVVGSLLRFIKVQ